MLQALNTNIDNTRSQANHGSFYCGYLRKCTDMVMEQLQTKWLRAPELKNPYWIYGADNGDNYCVDCIDDAVNQAKSANPDRADDILRDGGWPIDMDSVPFCKTCGERLNHLLTDNGAEQELEHYIMYGLGEIKTISDLGERQSEEIYNALNMARHWCTDENMESSIIILKKFLKLALPLLNTTPS